MSTKFAVCLKSAPLRSDDERVTDLVVKPWKRYGHDRLYVQTADGTRLGYRDNKTGQTIVEDETYRETVETAIARHGASIPTVAVELSRPVPPTVTVSEPASPTTATAVVAGAPAPFLVGPPADPAVPPAAPHAGSVPVDPPAPNEPVQAPWTDLSGNLPGQAAREQAVAYKRAAPIRTLFARVLGVHTDERAWRIGADAEEAVAARLARLGPDWRVLHAVPVGERGSDIDHVIIGHSGVFTVNTKHHPQASVWVGGNTFMVNGQRHPDVRTSRHEAQRAARLLTAACGFPVTVTGLIAVMGAHEGFTVREQPTGGDVHAVTRRELDRWLSLRPAGVLTAEQVEAVHDAARRSTTWQT